MAPEPKLRSRQKQKTLDEKIEDTKRRFAPEPEECATFTVAASCASALINVGPGSLIACTSISDVIFIDNELGQPKPAPPEPPKIPDWLREKMEKVRDGKD